MSITPKYAIDQRVWPICRGMDSLRDECPVCKDADTVKLADGRVFDCPQKYKHGHRDVIQRWWPWRVRLDSVGHIGQIRTVETAPECVRDSDRDAEREKRERVSYMIVETGVGSGSVYYEPEVFPSVVEAEAECDRLNAADATCQPQPAWNGPNKCKSCGERAGGVHKTTCKYAAEIARKMKTREDREYAAASKKKP